MEKFCQYCGREKIKILSSPIRYNTETGKEEFDLVCSDINNCKSICQRLGHKKVEIKQPWYIVDPAWVEECIICKEVFNHYRAPDPYTG